MSFPRWEPLSKISFPESTDLVRISAASKPASEIPMKALSKIIRPVFPLALLVMLSAGCSAEAKKERQAKRAEEFFKQGDYDRAKLEYTTLLRLDPGNPEGFEKIGLMWMEEGAPLRAGPFFARAKELAPARPDIRTKLAELYINVGSLANGRQEALEALQMQPGNEMAVLLLVESSRSPEEVAEAESHVARLAATGSVNYHLASATLALRKNDFAGMQSALKRAIETDPKSATAHLAMGRFHVARSEWEAARNELKLASELSPPRSSAQLLYAEILVRMGKKDEAVANLKEVVKKVPGFIPGWILLARITGPQNPDEALAQLENVFRRDAQNIDARVVEAEVHVTKGDRNKAVETLKTLVGAYPQSPQVKFQLARLLVQNGNNAEAITTLDQALAINPNYSEAILLLAEVQLRAGNPTQVAGSMEEFLSKNPNSFPAQVMLADAYRALGRFDDGAAILRKQIDMAPGRAEPHLLLGVLLRQQNKPDEARQELEQAFSLAPDNLKALDQLIELDIQAKNYAAAQQRVEEKLAKTPEDPGLHLLAGKIAVAQQKWTEAEAALTKVMQLNAEIPAAYDLLVRAYIAMNKLPEAAAQLEAFLAKSPNSVPALTTLAMVHSEMKQHEKARDAYEKALSLRPDMVVAMNNLAYIYSDQLNQLDKAREWASRAHTADPKNAAITDTFGWILYRQGDYKQAANILKEAADALPNEPEVQHHLGMAAYMMGDSAMAKVAFEKAVSSPRDFPGKDEAKRRLELLAGGGASTDAMSVEELQALQKQNPNDPLTMVKLAEAYERQGDPAKAASLYEQAISINSTLGPATMRLAQLYAGPLQKKERALELAKKARDLMPADARSTAMLGRLAFQAGNFTWAHSLLQESSRQAAAEPSVLRDYAWAAYSIGRTPDARAAMEKIVTTAPSAPEAKDAARFLALTPAESQELDPAKAESEAKAALAEDPKYVPALMVQAKAQAASGQKQPAIAAYQAVLSTFPDFAPAQKELAGVYLADPENRSKAHDLATAARKTMPNDPELAAILGEASFHRKDFGRAAQLLEESNRKTPLGNERLCYLGMALVQSRQVAKGREILQRATTNQLPQPLADQAAEMLRTTEPR